MQTLLSNVRFEEMVAHGSRSGATSNINGAAVDMKGFEGVLTRLEMGAISASAVTALKGQESDANNGGWSDVKGSKIAIAADDDNKYVTLDVSNVRKRYYRSVVERGTANATVRSAQYIKYNPAFARTAQPSADLTKIVTPA